MSFTPELLFQLVTMVLAAAGTWGAIRMDIKHLHEKTGENKELALGAHNKIDSHIRDHVTGSLDNVHR